MMHPAGLNAELFYQERDSRTNRVVAQPTDPIGLTIGIAPRWAATLDGQLAMYWLCGLIARMGRRYNALQIWIPRSVAQVPCLISNISAPTFADAVLKHLQSADPFGRYTITAQPTSKTYIVCVGAALGEHTRLVVRPLGWGAGAGGPASLTAAAPEANRSNPIGAALAAALGAAAVYQAFNRETVRYEAQLPMWISAWNHATTQRASDAAAWDTGPRLKHSLDIGRWLVIGAGALGGNALAILGQLSAMTGRIDMVDPDDVDISNLNRLEAAGLEDVGRPKVDVAGHALGHTEIEVATHRARYERLQEARYTLRFPIEDYDLVVTGVDRLDTRAFVQGGWPRILVDAGTRGFTWRVSQHRADTTGACLGCIIGNSQTTYRDLGVPLPCAVGQARQVTTPAAPMDSYGFVSFFGASFLAASALQAALGLTEATCGTPMTSANALYLNGLQSESVVATERCLCRCQVPVVRDYRDEKYAAGTT